MKKIAIPVMENKQEQSPISEHFGRAPFFAFLDGSGNILEIQANPFAQHRPAQLPIYLAEQGVTLMVVRGIGQRAIAHFNQRGIQIIRGAGGTIGEIMASLKQDKLQDTPYNAKQDPSVAHCHHTAEPGEIIALPATGKDMNAAVDPRFARAPFFLVHNQADGVSQWWENDFTGAHGAGPAAVQKLSQAGITTLIIHNLGQNALQAMKTAGMRAFKAGPGGVADNLGRYQAGELAEFIPD